MRPKKLKRIENKDDLLKLLENNNKFNNAIKLRKYEDASKLKRIRVSTDLEYIRNLMHKFIL